jgi:O-antigen/teichoic acid export membrane protein
MAPVAARLYQDGQYILLDELIKVIEKWVMVFSFPFALIIMFAPKEILGLVLGSYYEAGASLLVVLIFAQVVYVVFGLADQILLMTGHHKDWLLISAGTFFASFVLDIIFVPWYGLFGAAFVSLSSSIMVLLISLFRVRKLVNIWPYDRRHLKPLAAAGVTALLLYFVVPLFSLEPIYSLLLTTSISLFTFGGVIVALGIDAQDKNMFQGLLLGKRND